MAVDSSAFLTFAGSLDADVCEMHVRTKISRSYYGAFHVAKANIERKLGNAHVKFAHTSHQDVIEHYTTSVERKHKSIGYVLQDLKKRRHIADYELTADLVAADAVQVHESCKILCDRIENLPDLPPPGAQNNKDADQTAQAARPALRVVK